MQFEWDENKNKLNQQKQGVAFEEAQKVFDDPYKFQNWITDLVILKNDG